MTDLTGWTNVSERVYVWNYATNFEEFIAPFPNVRTIEANIKLFGQLGVKGLFEEAAYGGPGGDLSELKSFLMSSLMW